MSGNKVLDVREVDKQLRKMMILNLFEDLKDGQIIELISDHSLVPLNLLFKKEKHGFFEWTDLESGPETWKISIKKIGSLNLTILEIMKQYPLATDILNKHEIPYFRLGNEKLFEVCKNAQSVYEEIKETKQYHLSPLRTDNWSISFTVDYILNNHHSYVKSVLPKIDALIDHLVQAHASTHPQLPMIKENFTSFRKELTEHIIDEENIVFPSYKKLELSALEGLVENIDTFDDAINWMEEDHILTGTTLRSMRKYSNNYIAPKESSPGFKILFEELKKFEADMFFHIHLENNVLFTKVSALLNQVKKLS